MMITYPSDPSKPVLYSGKPMPYCAGITSNGLCIKYSECANWRDWTENPEGVAMVLCIFKERERFVPIRLEAAPPQSVQLVPVGKTMDMFA